MICMTTNVIADGSQCYCFTVVLIMMMTMMMTMTTTMTTTMMTMMMK